MISHFVRSADSPRFLSDGKPIVSDERLPLLRATCNWIVDFAMLLANQALEFARLHRQAQRSTAPSDAASAHGPQKLPKQVPEWLQDSDAAWAATTILLRSGYRVPLLYNLFDLETLRSLTKLLLVLGALGDQWNVAKNSASNGVKFSDTALFANTSDIRRLFLVSGARAALLVIC